MAVTIKGSVPSPVKILVVDDQDGMRLTLKGILSKRGYDVYVAENGNKALELARKTKFRMILMDIRMPGMSGVETFLKIKEIDPKVTVIMMTAFAVEDEIRRAIGQGAYAVIHKPFDIESILSVIHECLTNQTLILQVDQQLGNSNGLKSILEEKGFKVICVESGEECVFAVKERRFQIILLDVKLPGINGIETLKQVKKIRPDVGVIMLTVLPEEQLIEDSIEHGSFACFPKPVDDTEKFLGVINQYLKEHPEIK